ncbi:uncharacterized protein LOC124361006 [Homalodisca vitripennis]|uniref:uncharacterized protein LOC124361006 n=1 Tax=Homalodisca vitripennis TaxID=197043 RepID=UPI001EEC6CD2|nr:uncharacterized protein LOC124361006 [Homalodisca vitripennis]
MSLNLSKCVCIPFYRISKPILHDYSVRGVPLSGTSEVRDLGVFFTSSLSWEPHVQHICNSALQVLGFLFRASKSFTDLNVLKLLYCCLVRPHLEYNSVVWSPHQQYIKDNIEKIQRRFLRLVGVRLGFRYLDVPVQEVSRLLNLPSMESRRVSQDLLFLYKLVRGELDCPDLLERINFRVPSGTRSRALFAKTSTNTLYAANSSLFRVQRLGNTLPDHLDFFHTPPSSFRSAVRSLQS